MTTILIILMGFLLYCAVVGLILRFITFIHGCDVEMRSMIGQRKKRPSLHFSN